jgi:hypothetical protein
MRILHEPTTASTMIVPKTKPPADSDRSTAVKIMAAIQILTHAWKGVSLVISNAYLREIRISSKDRGVSEIAGVTIEYNLEADPTRAAMTLFVADQDVSTA